jgi:hypothetical protein
MGSLRVTLERAEDYTVEKPHYRARVADYTWQYGISKRDTIQNAIAATLRTIASDIELGHDSPVDTDGFCALEIAIFSL